MTRTCVGPAGVQRPVRARAPHGRGDGAADRREGCLAERYPGKLGVVEEGALADLLLVDGNPLQDINLVADPARNFLVINEGRNGPQEPVSTRTC